VYQDYINYCGDLTETYGTVIILEDDLFVAPSFYQYALKALEACKSDPKLAGISLYNNSFNESAALPFEPLKSKGDFYLMQLPSSWGQIFTNEQWTSFKNWYKTNEKGINYTCLPKGLDTWSEKSWKKPFIAYLIESQKFFAYPFESYSMNLNEVGTNIKTKDYKFLNPLYSLKETTSIHLDEVPWCYDSAYMLLPSFFQEMKTLPLGAAFHIDYYGSKLNQIDEDDWVITSLPVNWFEQSFGLELKPIDLNVLFNIPGKEIYLTKKRNIISKNYSKKIIAYHYPIPHWYHSFFQQPIYRRLKAILSHQVKTITRKKL
jgi:hypothetical protein